MPFSLLIRSVGKPAACASPLVDHYLGLLSRRAPARLSHVAPASGRDNQKAWVMEREAQRLVDGLPQGAWLVALAASGTCRSSEGFAGWLQQRRLAARPVVFMVGGAFGLGSTVRRRCTEAVSLSPLTLPHDLALVVLLEQLYRAVTILEEHPYHK